MQRFVSDKSKVKYQFRRLPILLTLAMLIVLIASLGIYPQLAIAGHSFNNENVITNPSSWTDTSGTTVNVGTSGNGPQIYLRVYIDYGHPRSIVLADRHTDNENNQRNNYIYSPPWYDPLAQGIYYFKIDSEGRVRSVDGKAGLVRTSCNCPGETENTFQVSIIDANGGGHFANYTFLNNRTQFRFDGYNNIGSFKVEILRTNDIPAPYVPPAVGQPYYNSLRIHNANDSTASTYIEFRPYWTNYLFRTSTPVGNGDLVFNIGTANQAINAPSNQGGFSKKFSYACLNDNCGTYGDSIDASFGVWTYNGGFADINRLGNEDGAQDTPNLGIALDRRNNVNLPNLEYEQAGFQYRFTSAQNPWNGHPWAGFGWDGYFGRLSNGDLVKTTLDWRLGWSYCIPTGDADYYKVDANDSEVWLGQCPSSGHHEGDDRTVVTFRSGSYIAVIPDTTNPNG